jgi:antitoxin ParD1/3/4
MTIVLELPAAAAERLREEAAAKGMRETELLIHLVSERYGEIAAQRLTDSEFEALLDQIADITEQRAPGGAKPLSDYAVSRESIYEDHA